MFHIRFSALNWAIKWLIEVSRLGWKEPIIKIQKLEQLNWVWDVPLAHSYAHFTYTGNKDGKLKTKQQKEV